jgi:hypothetical protein
VAALFALLVVVAAPLARACIGDSTQIAVIDGEIPGGG